MSGKIESCPFCGVTPEPFSYPRHAPIEVTCNDEACPAFNIVVSVEDWNKRAASVVERQEPVGFYDGSSLPDIRQRHELYGQAEFRVQTVKFGAFSSPLYTSPPAPVALKDHEFRELANRLRDTAIQYRDADQLRERISMELRACLDKVKELNQ